MILYVNYLPQEYQDEVKDIVKSKLLEMSKIMPIDIDNLLDEAMNSKLSDLSHILGDEKIREYKTVLSKTMLRS